MAIRSGNFAIKSATNAPIQSHMWDPINLCSRTVCIRIQYIASGNCHYHKFYSSYLAKQFVNSLINCTIDKSFYRCSNAQLPYGRHKIRFAHSNRNCKDQTLIGWIRFERMERTLWQSNWKFGKWKSARWKCLQELLQYLKLFMGQFFLALL